MTIKWVKTDPLVMNGEPFCYGTRLTVRNLLEMRMNGLTPSEIQAQSPELKLLGIAEAYAYAADQRTRYAEFFALDGSLQGPGFAAADATRLPAHLRAMSGIVISTGESEPVGTYR